MLRVALSTLLTAAAAGSSDCFRPGAVMLDTSGNRIRAHQPYLVALANGSALWFGTSKVGASDGDEGVVNCYASTDASLCRWRYLGPVYNCTAVGAPEPCYVARPSVLRHPTGEYVMWAKGGGKSLQTASSQRLLGPYREYKAFDPSSSTASGGSQSFADHEGRAHLIFSQKPTNGTTRELRVQKLRDADWLGLDPSSAPLTIDLHLEAPVPFYSRVAKRYFVWSSHTSGWRPNPAVAHSAPTMAGPWTPLGNPSRSRTTFGTQGAHVLPLDTVSPCSGAQRAIYVGGRSRAHGVEHSPPCIHAVHR